MLDGIIGCYDNVMMIIKAAILSWAISKSLYPSPAVHVNVPI